MKVELLEVMGTDLTVVNSARVSFAKISKEFSDKDEKLIKYLADHKHWTPFSHCYLEFRVKAPIFVARQLFKHKVGLTENEVSRRYVDSLPEFYAPDVWRKRAENKKQGSSDELLPINVFDKYGENPLEIWYNMAISYYQTLLHAGVCPEQARMVLPQSMYTEWIWSGSLAAFARVCNLRLDPHAQKETQEVAEQISSYIKESFPVSWKYLIGDKNG